MSGIKKAVANLDSLFKNCPYTMIPVHFHLFHDINAYLLPVIPLYCLTLLGCNKMFSATQNRVIPDMMTQF